jgi:DUF1680 family protein
VPAWCRAASVTVNQEVVPADPDDHGYLRIHRAWAAGDAISYDMPMPFRFTVAHPAVDAVHGMAAIERGPVVYCFEAPDQAAGIDLNRVELRTDEAPAAMTRFIAGHEVVAATVAAIARDDSGWDRHGWATLGEEPRRDGRPVQLVAIPYRMWANRGSAVMRIFTPIWHGDSDE